MFLGYYAVEIHKAIELNGYSFDSTLSLLSEETGKPKTITKMSYAELYAELSIKGLVLTLDDEKKRNEER